MNDGELFEAVKSAALLRGDFTLRSGRKSKYYLDKYLFESQPAILRELGERFAKRVLPDTTRIAGAELGGVALAAAASLASGLPFVIIRNARKDYGTQKMYEGKIEPGDRILLVEDIATTGGQVLEAAKEIQGLGATVQKIVAVIDRQEGARENIEGAGFVFESLMTKADLGIDE
ncbi:MAG TPA: orotate phosphoribosyltransferase [Phycisphaerae bacterium]|jgi:orotate phosphoribosyltransferase|nr:orotate phosphoribosyltransferase [Phycisphaerae bacterium]HOB73829.1 orotate phosphoribosyltransferase [Phycisphaerae bacterium]HOJ53956.1 orotate phosphoribosyltransferase [Phycisphaerae bacterium]HOL27539.1 orotate phosphoribosyltransferase [Phycisphaerae bacterium]HPP22578.1 orotate phosphoribosyltransferase [Phycisphaerae bacterium]